MIGGWVAIVRIVSHELCFFEFACTILAAHSPAAPVQVTPSFWFLNINMPTFLLKPFSN